jgi:hypothetical protein
MFKQKLVAILAATLLTTPAWGTSFRFMADGVTEGASQQGTAIFDFADDLSQLTITLTNNAVPTSLVASEITGLSFMMSGSGSGTLTGVGPTSVINCSNVPSPCPAGSGSTPYTWGLTDAAGFFSLGSGFNAGTFAYQPFGIVNSNYVASGTNGLSDPATNPLLVGPVSFTIALSGFQGLPEINNLSFLFGAVPDAQAAVPEPQTLALLAVGLLALALIGRRKRQS